MSMNAGGTVRTTRPRPISRRGWWGLAVTNRRRAEVGLLSWTAALLFALPLLRNYFPNGPPVGASIDIYVYLWVIVMAVIAATLIVVAWLNQNGAALRAERAQYEELDDELDDERVNRGA